VLELLFPVRCVVCDALGASPCGTCSQRLRPAGVVPVPPALDSCTALLVYEGVARELITGLKYRNRRSTLPRLVSALAGLPVPVVDDITWAPTSAVRRRTRGFDQAELIARELARRVGLPCRRSLRRVSNVPQTGRSLAARLEGPSFAATRPTRARLLLVDDVITTGATLTAAARALRRAGASEVHGVVVARTPAPGDQIIR
jgi:predicted amidophosphoribosyltransferase